MARQVSKAIETATSLQCNLRRNLHENICINEYNVMTGVRALWATLDFAGRSHAATVLKLFMTHN